MKRERLTTDLVEQLKRCVCPSCKAQLTGRTQIGGFDVHGEVFSEGSHDTPKPGDASLCLYCSTKLVFIDGGDGFLRVRKMTGEEYGDLPQAMKDALNVDVSDLKEQAERAEAEHRDIMEIFAKWAKQTW